MSAEVRHSEEELHMMGEAIAETAAILDATTHRFLVQLRAFDQAGGWQLAGALTCAHWLSWRVGMDLGAAREKVRVARRLADLPLIDGALATGEVSYSKVRAMTRVATSANEADLLTMARSATGAQLERICRLTRQVASLESQDASDVEERRRTAISRPTQDGMVSIQIRLYPEEAARVMKALEVAAGGGTLVDGALALADSALCGSPPAVEDAPLRPSVEVVLHIAADTLTGETELGEDFRGSRETAPLRRWPGADARR